MWPFFLGLNVLTRWLTDYTLQQIGPHADDIILKAVLKAVRLAAFNTLAPGRFWFLVIFKLILVIDGWGIFSEIALRRMSLGLTDGWWLANIGSGNGLCHQYNKPIPEAMLIPIDDAICWYWATMN